MRKVHGKFWTISQADAAMPRDGARVLLDRWWATTATGDLLLYQSLGNTRGASPQCNSNRLVSEHFKGHPYEGVVFVPIVYLHWDEEWGYLRDERMTLVDTNEQEENKES